MMMVKVGNMWKYYSTLSEAEFIKQNEDMQRSVKNLLSKLNTLIIDKNL